MVEFKSAKLSDIDDMQALAKPEIESGIILHRNNDEIATNIRSYVLAFDEGTLVAFGALHVHAPTLAEVRSLVVKKELRGKGIGKGVVNNLLDNAKILGVKSIFTLTYQKAFFEKLAFKEIPKESLPVHKIWADCIKCKLFPVCDEIALIVTI